MPYKNTALKFLLFSLLWISTTALAHSPDFSSIIISKTENGQIVLQITSSLTAFQQEVNYVNGEGAYTSPEEFQDLVLQLFKSRFSLILNNNNTLEFKNLKVLLGHETKIIAEISNLPEEVDHIYLKNVLFKDLHNSQSVAIFLLNGFPKEKFTLQRNNKHELNIILEDENWFVPTAKSDHTPLKYLSYLITLIIGGLLLFLSKK
ncbi:hypothetical protein CLV90_2964 [Maribacter spongiicola]|uniref:LPXTG-motif cell wall-anchored protein n=1 Tax=Maribacter spongiicola TaxID=1206753 RepID=A0A4R7JZ75_9FLAO|nr:hypothetical protein [Maribacter spongiicola]TDT43840.1 hypothetical protein CLV90_2964 [Maribacter spongiicola]